MWQTGTIRVARIGDIAIDIHVSFGLVILWGAWQGWSQYGGSFGIVYGIFAVTLFFACILIHELAHSLQARALGLVVRRITLLPIGGVAHLETPPSQAWHELVISLVGPFANLGLAVAFVILGLTAAGSLSVIAWADLLRFIAEPGLVGLSFYLALVNLSLFLFNMLPAFPMDGGRALRAALAMAMGFVPATRLAAWIGRLVAIGMVVAGIAGLIRSTSLDIPFDILLIVVAAVVYLGANNEELFVRRRWALSRVEVGDVLKARPEILAPWDTISQTLVTRLFQHDHILPVVVEDRLVGLLTFSEARRFAHQTNAVTVAHAMRTDFPVLQLRDTVWVALQEMSAVNLAALPVVENNVFLGMVSLDDISHAWRFASRHNGRGDATLVSGDMLK